jgi:hypothetical protein
LSPAEATADAGVSAAAAVATLLASNVGDQLGELTNWSYSAGLIAAATGPVASPHIKSTLAQTTAVALVYGLVGCARPGADRPAVRATALQYLAWWVGGQTFAARMRASTLDIRRSDTEATVDAQRVAALRERQRIHDELHRDAQQALEEVRDLWSEDRNAALSRAAQAALRLRRGLRDDFETPSEFTDQLEELGSRAAQLGIHVDVVNDLTVSPSPALTEPVFVAAHQVVALLPGGVASRALLRASGSSGGLSMTIRYRGPGMTEERYSALCALGNGQCRVQASETSDSATRIIIEALRG